jgi:hypothetical protein
MMLLLFIATPVVVAGGALAFAAFVADATRLPSGPNPL